MIVQSRSLALTAACEFVDLKCALGYTEAEACKELAMWLGHNPHRTEVTYAYVPRSRVSNDLCHVVDDAWKVETFLA